MNQGNTNGKVSSTEGFADYNCWVRSVDREFEMRDLDFKTSTVLLKHAISRLV